MVKPSRIDLPGGGRDSDVRRLGMEDGVSRGLSLGSPKRRQLFRVNPRSADGYYYYYGSKYASRYYQQSEEEQKQGAHAS